MCCQLNINIAVGPDAALQSAPHGLDSSMNQRQMAPPENARPNPLSSAYCFGCEMVSPRLGCAGCGGLLSAQSAAGNSRPRGVLQGQPVENMKHKLPWLLQQLVDLPGSRQNKTDLCNSFGTIIPETKHF